jgi:hypothetical protein
MITEIYGRGVVKVTGWGGVIKRFVTGVVDVAEVVEVIPIQL